MSRPPIRTAAALAALPAGSHLAAAPGMGAPRTVLAALGDASDGKHWRLDSGLLLGGYPFLPGRAPGRAPSSSSTEGTTSAASWPARRGGPG